MTPLLFLILLATLSCGFTMVISNVGACTLLIPLGISIANQIGVDPRVAAVVVGLGVSNSFILPTHQVLVFAVMLFVAGIVMLIPVSENQNITVNKHFGIIHVKSGGETYSINLGIVLPVTALTGFCSGMVGVSGGSFLVPLMVLACGVPMHTAVGTASTLIASTAFMGFAGHTLQGDFNPSWAVPLAIITIVGGILGGKLALRTKPKHLKTLFAYTNWLAALFMIVNALHAKGIL